MSTSKYPNRDALRDANDLYLDAMRPFVVHYLKRVPGERVEDLIEDALTTEQSGEFKRNLDETNDIESAIDFSYFPHIIKDKWVIHRNNRNYGFAQQFDQDMTVQSMLWLIRKGRNSCEHRGTKDLDLEFVRVNLFLIAAVLGKINRSEEQREVEIIRGALDDTKERLTETEERLKAAEADNAEYKKSLVETKKRLGTAESGRVEYEKDNAELSKQVNEKENRRKKLTQQLKRAKAQNDKYKKDLAGAKQRLKKSEESQAGYKKRLKTASKELKEAKVEQEESEGRLNTVANELMAMQKLLIATSIGNKLVFPPFGTDSAVRILDRRGRKKQDYLLELLAQKQSTIIYVQSEEEINRLFSDVVPEKADVIEKHNTQISDVKEMEMLEKLARGELIAIVSSSAISMLQRFHHIENFVFCHLAPDLDVFFKRCEPAIVSAANACLHLIYNGKEDVKRLDQWLDRKYPNRETLGKFYTELKKLGEENGDFINPVDVYDTFDMAKLGIETGLTIFEELHLLERNKDGINLLPASGKMLDESKIHCRGQELKHGLAEVHAFQLEQPIEKIWEEMLRKVGMDGEQILREHNIHELNSKDSKVEVDAQPVREQNRMVPPTGDV